MKISFPASSARFDSGENYHAHGHPSIPDYHYELRKSAYACVCRSQRRRSGSWCNEKAGRPSSAALQTLMKALVKSKREPGLWLQKNPQPGIGDNEAFFSGGGRGGL